MVKWIDIQDKLPDEGVYVLVSWSEYIGICKIEDQCWDIGPGHTIPIFKNKDKTRTSGQFNYWAPLPEGVQE